MNPSTNNHSVVDYLVIMALNLHTDSLAELQGSDVSLMRALAMAIYLTRFRAFPDLTNVDP
jgi:hypothetical protein